MAEPAGALRNSAVHLMMRTVLPNTYGLTAREFEVLNLLATGAPNREIADALFIIVTTIKGHMQHIMRKLNLSSRTALVAFALQHGLVAAC